MIHLRVLGSTGLAASDGPDPGVLLAQPKRFALLAYLALARPRGPQRRDVLLLRFWPESDAEHGRGALRLALHFLRRALGEGVLVGRGDEGVGFAPGTLWCDALEFERALDEGRPADALELYRGELLAGFHLAGAPEWERWMEAERARLCERAAAAVRALVDAADAADDLEAGVRWARRGLEVAPDDEAMLQRLLVLLDAAGDQAGALRAYEAFVRRRSGDDDAPLPATQSIARAVRQRMPAARPPRSAAPSDAANLQPSPATAATHAAPSTVPSADHAALSAETASATLPVPSPEPFATQVSTTLIVDDARSHESVPPPVSATEDGGEKVRRRADAEPATVPPRTRWMAGRLRVRRPIAWVVAALLVLGLAIGGFVLRRVRAADAALSEDRVAVMPFRVRGAPQSAYLGEGLVDLLSTRLNGAGALHTVDPVALLGYASRQGLQPGDLDDGRAAAIHFQAGSFVVGDVVEAGGRVQVTASLYGVDGRRRASAEATADERQLFDVVDRLAIGLLAGEPSAPDQRLPQTAALTTRSLPALRSYLTGERWLRAGKFALAAEAYTEAAQADSTFALALYRLSTALDWVGQGNGARSPADVVRQAVRFRGRLDWHDRTLLEARDAYWNGSAAQAEQAYRAILAQYPTDVEAWHELGEVLFHRGVWMGVPLTQARFAFARVLALSPENESARIHLARIAAVEGRGAERDSLAAGLARLHPSHARALEMEALRAFGGGNAAEREAATERFRGLSYDAFWVNAWRVAGYTGDPAAGERLARVLAEPPRPPRAQALAHTLAAHMLAAQGRWRAADSALDAAAQLEPAYAAQVRASLALLPAAPASKARLDAARAALARVRWSGTDSVSDPIGNARRYCTTACREYLLGALDVRAGDGAAAARSIRALEATRPATVHEAERARYQVFALRARMAQRAGDPARALALLEKGWPDRTLPQFSAFETYAFTPERMLRAELLRALGRDREALAWYATVDEDLGAGIAWLAPSHLARAELCERLGDRRGAALHYARFLRLWSGADAGSQPAVAAARARLRALGG